MTREEAISFLQSRIDLINKYYPQIEDYREALEMAVKALEQKYCEDCISRELVLKHLKSITMDTNPVHYENKDKWYHANGFNSCKIGIEIYVENLEPVTPQPRAGREEPSKMGYWIRVDKGKLKCSECDIVHFIEQYPMGEIDWCPNCGTKMQRRIRENVS